MSVLHKTIGAVGFLFFFSFGLLSTSFATYEDTGLAGLYQYAKFDHQTRQGLAQAEKDNFKGGTPAEDEGILPKPARDLAQGPESQEAVLEISQITSSSRPILAFRSPILDFSPVLNL